MFLFELHLDDDLEVLLVVGFEVLTKLVYTYQIPQEKLIHFDLWKKEKKVIIFDLET